MSDVPGTVDMDIYGAFQVCALGILSTPLSVRLSRTYFNVQSRNVIFLWTCLNFSGRHVSIIGSMKSLILLYRSFMFDRRVLP
jgi:hypothetical protein